MRVRLDQPDVLQAALRLLHSLLLTPSSSDATANELASTVNQLSIFPSAAAASSSSSFSTVASASSLFSSRLNRSGALDSLLTLLESSLSASPRTHLEADAWADVHTMCLWAFSTIVLGVTGGSGSGGGGEEEEKEQQQDLLEAVDRAWPLILRSIRTLAQEEETAGSSSDASASVAPSSSSLQALSGALFVLAGRAAFADRTLEKSGGVVVSATLECAAACGAIARGGELARICLVFLLRIGGHASSASAVFIAHAPRAEQLLQPLFDELPSDSPLADVIADTLLMLQGKAPPPTQYRT